MAGAQPRLAAKARGGAARQAAAAWHDDALVRRLARLLQAAGYQAGWMGAALGSPAGKTRRSTAKDSRSETLKEISGKAAFQHIINY